MRHPLEDLCNALHSLPSSLQTWIELDFMAAGVFFHLQTWLWETLVWSTWQQQDLGGHTALGVSPQDHPHPQAGVENVFRFVVELKLKPEEPDMDHCWDASHFHPIHQQLLWWIIQISSSKIWKLCNLYTSRNSSAWWKVSRLVAMPSKLKPSSWSTFIHHRIVYVTAHKKL